MTKLFVEHQGDRIFVWACLTDREMAVVGEPYAYVRPGESFGGVPYTELERVAASVGIIDSDGLRDG